MTIDDKVRNGERLSDGDIKKVFSLAEVYRRKILTIRLYTEVMKLVKEKLDAYNQDTIFKIKKY